MVPTDPIADMLTCIRNAQRARHATVDVVPSAMKRRIADVLEKEGFISRVTVLSGKPRGTMRLTLRYQPNGNPMIQEIQRISKPGCRVYATADELGASRDVIFLNVVTTSKGVMTGRDASAASLGGEVICRIS
jgi:small subunit ribosomal protein S8